MRVYAGVHLAAVEDRTDVLVHDLRSSLAVGIDKIAVGIVVIIALGVAIAQGQLQCALRRNLAAELADAFLDSAIDGGVDCVDGFLIRLGDDDGTAVLGIATVDGLGLPDVGIGKTDDTGNDLGVVLLSHNS